MWPPSWLSSRRTPRIAAAVPRSPSSRSFSCSSFKDVQTLLADEQPESGSGSAPRSPSSVFHRVRVSTSVLRAWAHAHRSPCQPPPPPPAPAAKQQPSCGSDLTVVLYFTSLRIVRKTFEDCRAVRSILRGFRVAIDERDLSMDASYLGELQGITGRRRVSLPCLFVGGRLVGGLEEVRQLHESGELTRMMAGMPAAAAAAACGACGGLRFAVCEECSGSRKIYSEKAGFRACPACNVNGLIRCPSCCSSPCLRSFKT
ncbi:uncharacterized protein At5g39865-like [Syzygium oleosum]|uniref:uncharacterized protein At5g39865-like n=1 Tax=Syzygium oleosum TaxID=219896 RepID=UPI0011D22C82|nr:uncharacterized protein At5g39865-like [Syzygium oleosum]